MVLYTKLNLKIDKLEIFLVSKFCLFCYYYNQNKNLLIKSKKASQDSKFIPQFEDLKKGKNNKALEKIRSL